MFFRYSVVLALAVLLLSGFETRAAAIVDPELDDVEQRGLIGDIAKYVVGGYVTAAATGCIQQVSNECQRYYLNPDRALNCAVDFFSKNKRKCLSVTISP
ncbi:hypothetical protein TKK_0016004 [Trichogramma kaykai]